MDKEILEILKVLQNDVKTMQGDMKTMQGDMKTMQGDMKTMQGDMKSMQGDMKSMQKEQKETNQRLERVENKTDKNTLMLEDMNKKMNTIAEVYTSFGEQLDREKVQDKRTLTDRLDTIELAVTNTSSTVGDIKRDLSKMVRVTADNWADIAELKSIK